MGVHGNTDVVLDTIDSMKYYATDQILAIVDGANWDNWGKSVKLPCYKICGVIHGYHKNPYRNVVIGLKALGKIFPDAEYYCYCEYDALFTSDEFWEDLTGEWLIGTNLREHKMKFPLVERMLGEEIKSGHYMLGCCFFIKNDFMRVLEERFFDQFIQKTNFFDAGFFPGLIRQGGYDLIENLLPTLAVHFGGKLKSLSRWNDAFNDWSGNFRKYPIRWKEEITENYTETCIVHPAKHFDNPIRKFDRLKRKRNATN